MRIDRIQWSQRLRALAGRVLHGPVWAPGSDAGLRRQYIETFADGSGQRRTYDRPLLAWVLRVDPGLAPMGVSAETALWWAVHRGGCDGVIDQAGDGPLFPELTAEGIEVWHQAELAGVHALWHMAAGAAGSVVLRERCLRAAAWLMNEVQPDNVTLRPWAVHVFVLGAGAGLEETAAGHYADTLVHNCLAAGGELDVFSAVLLLDAADTLSAVRGTSGA